MGDDGTDDGVLFGEERPRREQYLNMVQIVLSILGVVRLPGEDNHTPGTHLWTRLVKVFGFDEIWSRITLYKKWGFVRTDKKNDEIPGQEEIVVIDYTNNAQRLFLWDLILCATRGIWIRGGDRRSIPRMPLGI